MTTTPTTEQTVHTPTCDALRTALIELLTTGQHPHAATPATLTAIGHTRRRLATRHRADDPAGRYADDALRHTALSSALGDVAHALLPTDAFPEPTQLYAALTVLAAITLGWLDALAPWAPHDDEASC